MMHRPAGPPAALSRWGLCSLIGLSCLWGAGPAVAAAVLPVPGITQAAPAARLPSAPVSSAALPPTLDLLAARLEDVDVVGLRVRLQGRWVGLHPTALRVADARGARTLGSLRAGQPVRLALEPPSPGGADRRIVLVIVEASP